MHILIVTGIFPPDIGGPASYVPAIAAELTERGHVVEVTTLSDRLDHDDSGYCFPVVRMARHVPRPLRVIQTVLSIIKRGRRADVLFVHGLALEAVIADWILRKPLVHKVVGDLAWERARTFRGIEDSLEQFQQKRYNVSIELVKRLRAYWVRQGTRIIVPSMYLKNIVQSWAVAEEKISVIYNAVAGEHTQRTAAPPLIGRLSPHAGKIVSAGRLVPWKGFGDLIAAVEKVPGAGLVIIGDGPRKQELEALVRKRNLNDRIFFTGQISRDEVLWYLDHADLFVLNSTYEGLPHIVLEAFAANTPVIATDTGGTGELVRDGYNGLLIPPGDIDSLERAIRSICDNEQLGKELAGNGFKTVQRFSWQRLADQTETVLVQ